MHRPDFGCGDAQEKGEKEEHDPNHLAGPNCSGAAAEEDASTARKALELFIKCGFSSQKRPSKVPHHRRGAKLSGKCSPKAWC